MTTTANKPKTFTPAQLVQIIESMNDTLEQVRAATWNQGTIVHRDRLQNIDKFLAQFARNLDHQGWWDWRVGILFKIRAAIACETWLEYYQAIGQCINAVNTLPTGVDHKALEADEADEPELVYSCECA